MSRTLVKRKPLWVITVTAHRPSLAPIRIRGKVRAENVGEAMDKVDEIPELKAVDDIPEDVRETVTKMTFEIERV